MREHRSSPLRGVREAWVVRFSLRLTLLVAVCALQPVVRAFGDDSNDPVRGLMNLMLQKGIISEDEASKLQSQMDAQHTNAVAQYPVSKWKISPGIKDLELYGDLRTRFEDRTESDPAGDRVELQRYRYSARLGLRGEVADDFYFGVRVETASSPRSTFVTMGTSSSGVPYQGPYGKSTGGINIGQAYLGWRPEPWLDLTVGKMANPLYTTTMLWSRNINPEGLAERFNYTIGKVDFFANFAQFLYQDQNPVSASPNLGLGSANGNNIFQIAWQGGLTCHINTNTSVKIAATLYQYYGGQASTLNTAVAPYFGDAYVGEGAYAGPGSSSPVNGLSGYGNSSASSLGNYSFGYPNNQVGINDLQVVEVPFEFNFKIGRLDAQIFGDGAYNLAGSQRAQAAAAGYAAYLANQTPRDHQGIFPANPGRQGVSNRLRHRQPGHPWPDQRHHLCKTCLGVQDLLAAYRAICPRPQPVGHRCLCRRRKFAGHLYRPGLWVQPELHRRVPLRVCHAHQLVARHRRHRPGYPANQSHQSVPTDSGGSDLQVLSRSAGP